MQYNPLPEILPMDNGGRLWVGLKFVSFLFVHDLCNELEIVLIINNYCHLFNMLFLQVDVFPRCWLR